MNFINHIISPPFNQFIESVFHFENFNPDHSIERVIPTGHIFLIFELDGYVRNVFDNETLEPIKEYSKVWISGMHKNYISISAHKNSEMLVIQFKASGLYPFLHQSVSQLTEKVIPAEVIFGNEILLLHEKILNAENSNDKFAVVDQWLENRFKSNNAPPKELLKIITQFKEEPISNFSKITNTYPHSQKHLIDQFKRYVGLTPKYYHRILRFNEILQKVQKKEKIVWTEIAYSCGYSDQSHFIREFKHFSGFNPQEFIEQELNQIPPNFFPLDS